MMVVVVVVVVAVVVVETARADSSFYPQEASPQDADSTHTPRRAAGLHRHHQRVQRSPRHRKNPWIADTRGRSMW